MPDETLHLRVDDQIDIRRARSIADYRACQDAQKRAWGIAEDGYLIPVATMVGANLHGGLVLGAFSPSGEAVAMSFAFLGKIEGRLCLYSQLTGVVPEHQSRGLGHEIKRFQRQIALAEGIEHIAWAFDPLQAGNAHFNLSRLGAHAVRFVANMYGERTDRLNAGVPSDRLIAVWDLSVEHPPAPPSFDSASELPRLIEVRAAPGRGTVPVGVRDVSPQTEPRLLLEIPIDITALRREDPDLAEAWRLLVGQAFERAFKHSYLAVHFVRDNSSTPRRGFYVLSREDLP